MSNVIKVSRRRFLASTAGTVGAAVALPCFVPSKAFGANERIITGCIGVGHQGLGDMDQMMQQATVAAVCDVDKKHAQKAEKRVVKKSGKCDVYYDPRKMLDRKDIDAVLVATPDHWHAMASIMAMRAGKHVYCEKPLTHSIGEGRAMVDAARKNKVVVQTGSQQRSSKEFILAVDAVRSGKLGKIISAEVGIPYCNAPAKDKMVPDSEPPAELDYDLWLGPAPYRPYNVNRVHYNFRFYLDYAGGQAANFGAHHFDIVQWALGMDDSGPIEVSGTGTFDPDKRFEVPASYDLTYTYANGVKVLFGQKCKGGATFIGEKGRLYVDRNVLRVEPADIEIKIPPKKEMFGKAAASHVQNWFECIKTGARPVADVEIGHRTATACHMANLCVLLGRTLRWDPAKEQFSDDAKANAMILRSYRKPWTLAEKVAG